MGQGAGIGQPRVPVAVEQRVGAGGEGDDQRRGEQQREAGAAAGSRPGGVAPRAECPGQPGADPPRPQQGHRQHPCGGPELGQLQHLGRHPGGGLHRTQRAGPEEGDGEEHPSLGLPRHFPVLPGLFLSGSGPHVVRLRSARSRASVDDDSSGARAAGHCVQLPGGGVSRYTPTRSGLLLLLPGRFRIGLPLIRITDRGNQADTGGPAPGRETSLRPGRAGG